MPSPDPGGLSPSVESPQSSCDTPFQSGVDLVQLTHIKTQAAQFFQVISEQQEVLHYRRWGPSLWERQFGETWSPVSGRAMMEVAYQRTLETLQRSSPSQSIPDELPSLPVEGRLMTALSQEQQALISDWLDEEISIYLTEYPHRSMSVHEHLRDLSARFRALAHPPGPSPSALAHSPHRCGVPHEGACLGNASHT